MTTIQRIRNMARMFSGGARVLFGSFLLCGALLAGGCSEDDGLNPGDGQPVAVNFTAGIDGAALPTVQSAGVRGATRAITGVTAAGVAYADYTDADGFQTRAFYPEMKTGGAGAQAGSSLPATRTTAGGDGWMLNDGVGIFMLTSGGTFPGNIVSGADNRQYKVTDVNTGALVLADGGAPIYYPQTGNVDFVAYYPYGATGTGSGQVDGATYIYKVSVAGQSSPAAIDLLYAKTANVAKSKTVPVNLAFSHAMSKVTLNVTNGDGIPATEIQNLAATAVQFGGMPVTADLSLPTGTVTAGSDLTQRFNPLKAATAGGGAQATFSAIVVPQGANAYTGRTVVFTVGGQDYTWMIPNGDHFAAGNHYAYPVTVSRTGATVGMPTITPWTTNDNGSGEVETPPVGTVLIPKGAFLMGSSDGSNIGDTDGSGLNTTPAEPERLTRETQHRVTLTKDFYMGRYEVTNAQYAAFLNAAGVGSGGSLSTIQGGERLVSATSGGGDWGLHWETDKWVPASGYGDHPVIFVSWYGAKAYADWIGGNLPTEAQWEYACRGDKGAAPFGIGTTGYALDNTLANFFWPASWSWDGSSATAATSNTGTAPGKTQAVGSYPANSYGLYDMHGNVWEWCLDQCDLPPADYGSGSVTDPVGTSATYRVLRGGYWGSNAQVCRSAYRVDYFPGTASILVGFRVVFAP